MGTRVAACMARRQATGDRRQSAALVSRRPPPAFRLTERAPGGGGPAPVACRLPPVAWGEGRLCFTALSQVVQRRVQVLAATQEDGRVGRRVAAHLGRAQVFDHARDGGWIVRLEGHHELLVAQAE